MNKKPDIDSADEEEFLERVNACMASAISSSLLEDLAAGYRPMLTGGKRLRSRLVYSMGSALKTPATEMINIAAAVELMHSGSLLHDDVLDDAEKRRGLPAFWTKHGVKGSILFGDLHFFMALHLLEEHQNRQILSDFINMSGEACRAVTEQELILSERHIDNTERIRLSRHKTGALFAFAASACATGKADNLYSALKEAGYALGTAYQLADDIYDTTGSPRTADKSLHRDRNTGITSTAETTKAVETINSLLQYSTKEINQWAEINHAWTNYLNRYIHPAINQFTANVHIPGDGIKGEG